MDDETNFYFELACCAALEILFMRKLHEGLICDCERCRYAPPMLRARGDFFELKAAEAIHRRN